MQLGLQNEQLQHQQQQLLPSAASLGYFLEKARFERGVFCFGSSWRGLLCPTLMAAFSSWILVSVADGN
jgi:hypothetical protein